MKIRQNPDKKVVEEVRAALEKTNGYCPCAIIHSDDTKCMCKNFRDQVAKGIPGECHCGLYVSVDE
jgi:ferredoxin-thioredoxin reductase catalytic subunit